MTRHIERQIDGLKERILKVGTLVEEAISKAITALINRDVPLAQRVMANDEEIDRMEVEVEEECLKMLALYQPVAADLRFVVAVLKINNDLERIADQAVNIGARIHFLYDRPRIPVDLQFEWMGPSSLGMVAKALDALLTKDTLAARAVLEMDSEIDDFHALTYRDLIKAMTENPSITTEAVSYLTISSNVERIADLATNIAEEIIFMNDGEILRHVPMD